MTDCEIINEIGQLIDRIEEGERQDKVNPPKRTVNYVELVEKLRLEQQET